MKGWFKLLVLATVPILAITMVVDQGLAADKGSQLIFQSNMAHQNYISVVNASDDAVTVLVQYYNNEMEMAVWYLRVILGGTNVLVDPFNHMIPGSGDPAKDIPDTNVGDAIMASGKGGNGHFVIAVTAVGANTVDDDDADGCQATSSYGEHPLSRLPGRGHAWDGQHRQLRRIQDCNRRSRSATAYSGHPDADGVE